MHDYNNCELCDCVEVKEEVGPHCQHCYHCLACSSAVAMGCRPCTCSPDRSFYRSYILRRRKGGDNGGYEDATEWYSVMGSPQFPDIYPDSPLPEQDGAVNEVEGKEMHSSQDESFKCGQLKGCPACDADDDKDKFQAEGHSCQEFVFGLQEVSVAEPFPPTASSDMLQKQATEALEKIWGGDRSKVPGLKKE